MNGANLDVAKKERYAAINKELSSIYNSFSNNVLHDEENYVTYLNNHLDRSQYDLVVGFNKIPNLDLYYMADVCYAARIQAQRSSLIKLTPRYQAFYKLERAVFDQSSKTEIIYLNMKNLKKCFVNKQTFKAFIFLFLLWNY